MRYFLISLFLIVSGTTHAEIYKWQDAHGKVGYGNVPPKDSVKYIEFTKPPSLADERKVSADTNSELSTVEREKRIAEDQEKLAKEAAVNCSKSKESLKMLESGVRVVRYNAKGEREVIDDRARLTEIQNAKRAIDDWCMKPAVQ